MRVELIAVPYDSGRRGERMGAGPEHLLQFGLPARLAQSGHEVRVRVLEAPTESWRAEIRTAFDLAGAVADAVRGACATGAFPLVLSGNCGPAGLGAVAGLPTSPAVFWFDAHGDFNTPETTIGGFLDGMALATLTGRCWAQLTARLPGFRPVPQARVTLIGARDLDPLEAAALETSALRRLNVGELQAALPTVLSARRGDSTEAYVHLDADVLDPSEGRANSYAAPAGLTLTEVEWAIRAIATALPLRVAALTSLDPASDPGGRASEAALKLAVALVDAAQRERGA